MSGKSRAGSAALNIYFSGSGGLLARFEDGNNSLFYINLQRNSATPSDSRGYVRILPSFCTENVPSEALHSQTRNATSQVAGKLFKDRKKCQGTTLVVP